MSACQRGITPLSPSALTNLRDGASQCSSQHFRSARRAAARVHTLAHVQVEGGTLERPPCVVFCAHLAARGEDEVA